MKRQGKNDGIGANKRRRKSARQPRPEMGCHDLLARLKSGEITGKCIHRTDRRRLVEYIKRENPLHQVEIAKLLQCNEKTISKDMAEIRKANALRADPEFADEIAGEILGLSRSGVEHADRIWRDKSTPPAVRVKAKRSGMRMYLEGMKMLQSLGHLPSAALRIKMEPNNAPEKPASLGDLVPELDRLAQIAAKESPGSLPLLNSLREAVRTELPPIQPPRTHSDEDTGGGASAYPAPPAPPSPPPELNR